MSDKFFTSDTHFFHGNIIKHCKRPFVSVEEMNETLIQNWNKKITNKDIVYHLGDVFWKIKTMSPEDVYNLINRLNFGELHIIPGNHDSKKILRNMGAVPEVCIEPMILEIKIGDQSITLCHYAMLSWNKSHYGTWQLFGHSHGILNHISENQKTLLRPTQMDVGVDTNNFCPYSFEEIRQKIEMQKINTHSNYPEHAIQVELNNENCTRMRRS
jgi:calcineurin-like phosphoesterase family protein